MPSLFPSMELQAEYDQFLTALKTNNPNYQPLIPIASGSIKFDSAVVSGGTITPPTQIISQVICPSCLQKPNNEGWKTNNVGWGKANYVGIAGNDDLSRNWGTTGALPYSQPFTGIFYPNSRISLRKITDGTTATLMLGEVYGEEPTSDATKPIASNWCGVTHGSWINGVLRSTLNSPKFWINVSVVAQSSSRWNAIRSRHSGGANFCLADASVVFLSDRIDTAVYDDLSTIAGAENGRIP